MKEIQITISMAEALDDLAVKSGYYGAKSGQGDKLIVDEEDYEFFLPIWTACRGEAESAMGEYLYSGGTDGSDEAVADYRLNLPDGFPNDAAETIRRKLLEYFSLGMYEGWLMAHGDARVEYTKFLKEEALRRVILSLYIRQRPQRVKTTGI